MDIQIGLLGCGTVGAGVAKLLTEKAELYAHRIQRRICLKKVLVRSTDKLRSFGLPSELLTTNADDILNDPDIQIVVEVMGGEEPARDYLLRALKSGKHVVTANKALIARHGKELFETATANNASLFIEASVAGGLPIIQTIKRSLVANKVLSLYGIINGTTNYILSAMTHQKRDFKDVLAEAQQLGYAEADPTDDVEGYDAVYKLAILSSLVFGHRVNVDEVYRAGIERVTPLDIQFASQFGYRIKLLAIAKQEEDDKFEARVHPTMIPAEHPLASVDGVFNAILMKGDAVGDIMFYGQGAGQLPTASAVVSDILNIVSDMDSTPNSLMACQHNHTGTITPIDQLVSRYYIRISTDDRPGVLGHIGDIFGKEEVSIHTLIQHKASRTAAVGEAELVFITHPVVEAKLRHAISRIQQLRTTRAIHNMIRVEDFE